MNIKANWACITSACTCVIIPNTQLRGTAEAPMCVELIHLCILPNDQTKTISIMNVLMNVEVTLLIYFLHAVGVHVLECVLRKNNRVLNEASLLSQRTRCSAAHNGITIIHNNNPVWLITIHGTWCFPPRVCPLSLFVPKHHICHIAYVFICCRLCSHDT